MADKKNDEASPLFPLQNIFVPSIFKKGFSVWSFSLHEKEKRLW